MEDQEEITYSITVVVTPEPDISAADKEGFIRGLVLDQIAAIARNYDWGITVNGQVTSTALADPVTINDEKPLYQF